jgi:phage repressor protein C with HTH and peptisase S24 domain
VVKELATNGVEYQALLETCGGDIDHYSNWITGGSYEPTISIKETLFVPPGNKVLIGIGIIGDGRLDKGVVC